MIAIGLGLVAFGLLACVCQLAAIATSRRGRGYSIVPLVGGLGVLAGCALLPVDWRLGLVGLAIDPGCGLMFGGLAVVSIRRFRASRRARSRSS